MRRRTFLRSAALLAGGLVLPHPPINAEPAALDVYLALDAASNGGLTGLLPDILRDFGATATIFIRGAALQGADGAILRRYIDEGHAVGITLRAHSTNTARDAMLPVQLAYNWFLAEDRIQEVLRQTDSTAFERYAAQPRLFRDSNGSELAEFLAPDFIEKYERNPVFKQFQNRVPLLRGVYDYSGLHPRMNALVAEPERFGHALEHAGHGLILGGDAHDESLGETLPRLLRTLRDRGARFHSLPRPVDQPNRLPAEQG
jgi:peptidoglycan/xylan/chitin deacetylase (PgdA/CDA1 family)